MLKCPNCGSENSRVIDSRKPPKTNGVKRIRLCGDCGEHFITAEIAIPKDKDILIVDRKELNNVRSLLVKVLKDIPGFLSGVSNIVR